MQCMRRVQILTATACACVQAARSSAADVCKYMHTLQESSLAGHEPPDGLADYHRTLVAAAETELDALGQAATSRNGKGHNLGMSGVQLRFCLMQSLLNMQGSHG